MSSHMNISSSFTPRVPAGDKLTDSNGQRITLQAILPYGLVFLQCALLHPTFVHSRLARIIRRSLTPINVIWAFMFPFRYCFRPIETSGQRNMGLAAFSIYTTLKCLEWGFVSGPFYKRPLKTIDGVRRWEKETSDSYKKAQEDEPRTAFNLITWTVLQMSSMRGLQFTWGPGNVIAKSHSSMYLIGRILRLSVPLTCALAFIIMTRDSPLGTPTSGLLSIGVPNFPGLKLLAESVYTVCFGVWLSSNMDLRFTVSILLTTLVHKIAIYFQCSEPILELCDPVYYPLMFESPQGVNSIADFWGKAWHSFLKRVFTSCGGKPAMWIMQKLGARPNLQKMAGLFGVFAVSAFLHEYLAWGYAQPPHPSPHTFTSFPGSGLFFLVQPLAMLLEPFIIPLIPKRIGGGKLWVWSCLILLCYSFRLQFLEKNGIVYRFPPVSQWSWMYILSPLKD